MIHPSFLDQITLWTHLPSSSPRHCPIHPNEWSLPHLHQRLLRVIPRNARCLRKTRTESSIWSRPLRKPSQPPTPRQRSVKRRRHRARAKGDGWKRMAWCWWMVWRIDLRMKIALSLMISRCAGIYGSATFDSWASIWRLLTPHSQLFYCSKAQYWWSVYVHNRSPSVFYGITFCNLFSSNLPPGISIASQASPPTKYMNAHSS